MWDDWKDTDGYLNFDEYQDLLYEEFGKEKGSYDRDHAFSLFYYIASLADDFDNDVEDDDVLVCP